MVTNNSEKLWVLMWKNCIIQWKHKCEIVLMFLIPILVFLLYYKGIETSSSVQKVEAVIYNQSLPIDNLDLLRQKLVSDNLENPLNYHLAYSPNTSLVFEKIVKEAATSLGLTYSGYANAKALDIYLGEVNELAGVEFEDSKAYITKYPKKLNYRLRFPNTLRTSSKLKWYTNQHFFRNDEPGPRNKDDIDGGSPPGYLREGFLPVQNAISTSFIKQSAENQAGNLPKVLLQRYPYPEYINNKGLSANMDEFPVLIVLLYCLPALNTVRYIVKEKEKQLKEIMKIMGLQNWLHWAAFFLKAFLLMSFLSLLVTFFLTGLGLIKTPILKNSSSTAVLFFFLIYTIVSIAFCFMLTTFFSNVVYAGTALMMMWIFTYSPYSYTKDSYSTLSLGSKLSLSLFSNSAGCIGVRTILTYEIDGVGLHWSNMFSQVNIDETLSMAHIIGMMCLDSVIYLVICLYVEQINPGEFGVPKKWNFPFKKSFWYGKQKYVRIEDSRRPIERDNPEAFEVDPIGKKIGIHVKNLSKTFGKKKAVKNVSMNMYKDEITVLLGHNGAGKTTTVSMLTGMLPPTSGTAYINGMDIRTNADDARMSLGICPQHNILFDDLTVKDHLIFYSRLKGVKGAKLEEEVESYLRKLDLEDKANTVSSKLSGGMKRKLSVGVAFCGGNKFVLCDEPSSGMDPSARRRLWDFLQSQKIGCTVLLTTHLMDEADVLGDRIAIFSEGELKSLGTSFFLKKKFGGGYHLICEKLNGCNSAEVTKLLRKYIPDIQVEAEIGSELSYKLPESYSPSFEKMFQDLEANFNKLNLNGCGISMASLETVFIKVGAQNPRGENFTQTPTSPHGSEHDLQNEENINIQNIMSHTKRRRLKGIKLISNQWRAMILKKYLFEIRNKCWFSYKILIPILLLPGIFSGAAATFKVPMPISSNLFEYKTTVTVLETTSNVKEGSLEAKISQNYKSVVDSYGSNHKLALTRSLGFIDYILKLGKLRQDDVNKMYIAAATVNDGTITAWLNNKPLHSAPIAVNLIHNAMARTLIGPNAGISVTNAPLQDSDLDRKVLGIITALAISVNMAFVAAMYVMFPIKERESGAKQLQFIGGVGVATFWLSHFIWDMISYTISSLVVIILMAAMKLINLDQAVILLFFLLLFGCAVLPFSYLVEGLFSDASTGYYILLIYYICSGFVLFLIQIWLIAKRNSLGSVLGKFGYFLPNFLLTKGLINFITIINIKKSCEIPDDTMLAPIWCQLFPHCCTNTPYFGWEEPGVLQEIIFFIITSFMHFLLLILNEYGILYIIWSKVKRRRVSNGNDSPPPRDANFDEDVEYEKERVRKMSSRRISEQNLVADRVTKNYGKFVAVKQISFAVQNSECFGLLGVNGAGKTTTFKMLVGEIRMSSGEAFVKGLSLRTNMNKVYKEIGYCPQFDAIFDDLTGREVLKIFCLLHGIPGKNIPRYSRDITRSFGFIQHYNKRFRNYSGGNKRKLSTAVAVLCSPSVVYLDEPTTGLDPGARRRIWNLVNAIRDAKRSIVLTSHLMEECEALCTRLVIMVNGEFKCIGSIQHLKNKYTKGFILKVKIKMTDASDDEFEERNSIQMERNEENIRKVMYFIGKEFPKAVLKERYQGTLTFHIPMADILWSRIFGLMEKNKSALNIDDYSVSQTSLEEIFLEFAKSQRNEPT